MLFNFKSGVASGLKRKSAPKLLLLTAVVVLLQGMSCDRDPIEVNAFQSFSINGRSTHPVLCVDDAGQSRACTEDEKEALRFAEAGKEITLTTRGVGYCEQLSVDWGDGTPKGIFNYVSWDSQSNTTVLFKHTYQAWPGAKMIRVKGEQGCIGEASKEIRVGMGPNERDLDLALCYGAGCPVAVTSVCTPARTFAGGYVPPIRQGSVLRIATNGSAIDYGPAGIGVRHLFDASGDSTVQTPPGYLFTDRKKFSLVYRIGSEHFQGEAGQVIFTTHQSGPLEICTNDNPNFLADNSGNMTLSVRVNETGIP